jgi:hypothetical protein
MLLTVTSNVVYHFSQKGIARDVDPLVSLTATYATALAATLIAVLLFSTSNRGYWTTAAWGRINWASYAVGLSAVGLELGFLWAYRAGWKLSFATIYSNALVTMALIPIGLLMFGETMTMRKGAGIVLALSGLWALSGL